MAHQRTEHIAKLVVIVATALFVLFFGASNWMRQANLLTAQFDMGNMDQVLWHSLHGQWFQMTDPGGAITHLRTAIHTDYLLLIYLPFYAVFQDPRTPLVLQVLAVASGVIPLFLLARKKLGALAAAFIVLLYLLYPTLEWAVTFDVHAVVLVTPLILWAWWAAEERKWLVYYPAIALAVLGKEEVGLVVAAMGLFWIWRRTHRTMAIISIALGIGWTVLMLGWAIPSARDAPGHFAIGYYGAYGDSFTSIIRNVFQHPISTLSDFFGRDQLSLIRQLLFPVGGIALLGLPVLFVALPEFAVNFLSSNVNQHSIFFHYMSVITPFMFLSVIDGWARARRWRDAFTPRFPRIAGSAERVAIVCVIALAAVSIWKWSPLPGLRYSDNALDVFKASPYRQDVRLVQASLKPADRVVTTNNLGPQFSRRDMVWGFPRDLDKADAIVILEGGDYDLLPKEQISAEVLRLSKDPAFTVVHHRDQFWYLRRNSGPSSDVTATAPAPVAMNASTDSVKVNVALPIADFFSRITKKQFGQYITPQNSPIQPERFKGYHTGVDAEIVTGEEKTDVPVYSSADGTVVYVNYVSGYGGVVMIQCDVSGETVTALYGHVRLSAVTVKKGDAVTAGQKIAVLGTGYSKETDGERKHLHFGLLKGASLNVKGYVQSSSVLSAWYDPAVWLKDHGTVSP
ncbi:MAG: DUF2079 domain-containing protein [Candidatus Kerfeldbacteria bacterium]